MVLAASMRAGALARLRPAAFLMLRAEAPPGGPRKAPERLLLGAVWQGPGGRHEASLLPPEKPLAAAAPVCLVSGDEPGLLNAVLQGICRAADAAAAGLPGLPPGPGGAGSWYVCGAGPAIRQSCQRLLRCQAPPPAPRPRSALLELAPPFAAAQAHFAAHFLTLFVPGMDRAGASAQLGRMTALVRPAGLEPRRLRHGALWAAACAAFRQAPRGVAVRKTWRPALDAVQAAALAPALAASLCGPALQPCPMAGLGRLPASLMLAPNLQVSHSGELSLSFAPVRPLPYRIDLRFSAGAARVRLCLRPAAETPAGRADFVTYLSGHVLSAAGGPGTRPRQGPLALVYRGAHFIRYAASQPVFHPFAPGGAGAQSAAFDAAAPFARAEGRACWLEGEGFSLSLPEAAALILRVFD